jgi:hypothetical protein
MAGSTKRRGKDAIRAKQERKAPAAKGKPAEYVSHLVELHRLQGVLLAKLSEEISR